MAAFVLWRALHGLSFAQVAADIARWGPSRIAGALTLAGGCYVMLALNEQVGLRWAGAKVRLGQGLFASFVSIAFANNIGMGVLMGGALRAGLYARYNLSLTQVAKVTLYGTATFSLGASLLAGASFLRAPSAAFALLHLRPDVGRLLGAALVLAPGLYVLVCGLTQKPLNALGRSFQPPHPLMALAQIGFGLTDVALSAALMWLLLGDASPQFAAFLGAYLISMVAGLMSGVPGGVGVFEGVMLTLLPSVDRAALAAALIGYRLFFYLTPLACAALLLAVRRAPLPEPPTPEA
ncbi:MAG: lysylphosphatidylglycerol synthase domain-containing protein [Caulobacteraceae bacterium]|nr:lysylphosphatidylglycerol synthase domain-containing protein [Caulobacteraceae bacterium]